MQVGYVHAGLNGQALNQGCYSAYLGMQKLGYKVVFFKNIDEIEVDRTSAGILYAGGINTIRSIISKLDLPQPEVHSPHIHLPEFVFRKILETTMDEVRKGQFKTPFFIKPLVDDKLFTGYLVKDLHMDLISTSTIPSETKILLSEPIEIISEYRVFVSNKSIVGCKNYTGDFSKVLDFNLVNRAIESYSDQPASYSIDFAINKDGTNCLIEINDAFGIAPYGFDPVLYTRFLQRRWSEITKSIPNINDYYSGLNKI